MAPGVVEASAVVVIRRPVIVTVRSWTACGAMPLSATIPIWYVPSLSGVPDNTPPVNVIPLGIVPVAVIVGAGLPVAVGVKVPLEPRGVEKELADVMTGASPTIKVNAWVASGKTPLLALIVIGKLPSEVGMPASLAVPSPLSVKVTPEGGEPVSDRAAVGAPAVVTVKLLVAPLANPTETAEVMAGGWSITSVNS